MFVVFSIKEGNDFMEVNFEFILMVMFEVGEVFFEMYFIVNEMLVV